MYIGALLLSIYLDPCCYSKRTEGSSFPEVNLSVKPSSKLKSHKSMSPQLSVVVISYQLILSLSQLHPIEYICHSPETCTVTCGDANGDAGELKCDDYVGFDATYGPFFNLLCPGNNSCQNLDIKCPIKYTNQTLDGHCNITCSNDNACHQIKIHSYLDHNLMTELNCYGDDNHSDYICNNITIEINQNTNNNTNINHIDYNNFHQLPQLQSLSSSINLNCKNNGPYNSGIKQICSAIDIIESPTKSPYLSSLLSFKCEHKSKCMDISIDTPNIYLLNISIIDSLLTESKFNAENNINLYLSHSNLSLSSITNQKPSNSTPPNRQNISVNIIVNTNSTIIASAFYIANIDKVILSSNVIEEQISQLINSTIQVTTSTHDVNYFEIININTISSNTSNTSNTIKAQYVNMFTLKCSHKYCGQIDKVDISNVHNASFDITQGSILSIPNLIATTAGSVKIMIDKDSFLEESNIDTKSAQEVAITMFGQTRASNVIQASEANIFKLFCLNDYSCNGDKLVIHLPAKTGAEQHAFIKCKGFGCNQLTLYTKNPPSQDIVFNKTDCDCADDVTNGCLEKWELYCGETGDQHAVLSNATSCVAKDGDIKENLCCQGLIEDLHDEYECPWPSNTTFVCIENEECIVSCNDIKQQTNQSHFKCSNKGAIIDATEALTLNLDCGDKDDSDALCNNGLVVKCPELSGGCIINCDSDESCKGTKINTQKTNKMVLNCNGKDSCYQTS